MFNIIDPIVIDTETFYDSKRQVSIKKNLKKGWIGGNWHYTNHPEFYAYMITFVDLATGEFGVIDSRQGMVEFLDRVSGRTMVAHNAGFDYAVCKRINPRWEPAGTVDTGDMAAYLQLDGGFRRLSDVVKNVLGAEMSKVERDEMDAVHYWDLPEDRKERMRKYAGHDVKYTAELYRKLLPLVPKLELFLADHTRRRNWDGVHIDTGYLQEQIDKVMGIRARALSAIPWFEGNVETDTPLSPKKLAEWCRTVNILPPASLAEDSPECMQWEAVYGKQFPVVAAMRNFRKSNTYLKKLNLIELLLRPDKTIQLDAMYAAAPHTLRWSGRTFNHQSLPRDSEFCDLRGCLIAGPGQKFIPADLAQIEARCLPWLAGDWETVGQLAKMDIYEVYARKFGWYSGALPLKKADKKLREASKVCVLQLGYQSGGDKFAWYIETNVKEDVIERIRRPDETVLQLAKRLVYDVYRKNNPKIVKLWGDLDHDVRVAAAEGADTLDIQAPNGRVTRYYNPRFIARKRLDPATGNFRTVQAVCGSTSLGDEPRDLYGGKLTENLTQLTARDVVAECLYRVEKAGIPVGFSVHDELVCRVPEARAAEACKEVEHIMAQTPAWLPGCPIAAEASVLDRYAK